MLKYNKYCLSLSKWQRKEVKMKKIICITLIMILALTLLVGCGKNANPTPLTPVFANGVSPDYGTVTTAPESGSNTGTSETPPVVEDSTIPEGFKLYNDSYISFVHPESFNQKDDIKYLKEKVDAGCEFLTTQMFFDNNLLYNFLYKIREAGITVPVIAGIMPITNANQVARAVKLSGSFMPQRFKSLVDKFGSDPLAMKQAGIAYATDQIIDLYANNITNVHVYSMNKPDVAEKIQANLSDIIGK